MLTGTVTTNHSLLDFIAGSVFLVPQKKLESLENFKKIAGECIRTYLT